LLQLRDLCGDYLVNYNQLIFLTPADISGDFWFTIKYASFCSLEVYGNTTAPQKSGNII